MSHVSEGELLAEEDSDRRGQGVALGQVQTRLSDNNSHEEVMKFISVKPSQKQQFLLDKKEEFPLELVQANPILSKDRIVPKQQINLKIKLTSRDKFNKTSLSTHEWKQSQAANPSHNKRSHLIQHAQNGQTSYHSKTNNGEFSEYLLNKTLIYRRLDNSELNTLGKNTNYCSVYLSLKNDPIQAKTLPIPQHLITASNKASASIASNKAINTARTIPASHQMKEASLQLPVKLNTLSLQSNNNHLAIGRLGSTMQLISPTQAQSTNGANSSHLSFSSAFESGNLFAAYFQQPSEPLASSYPKYSLLMQNDINTKGCTQWFYFSVASPRKGKYRLLLANFYKANSLYEKGMKVLSSSDLKEWKRVGTSVSYTRVVETEDKVCYGLEFTVEIEPNRTVYFCYAYPYTYTAHLHEHISRILPRHHKICSKSLLCHSAMGNPIPMLTITSASQLKSLSTSSSNNIRMLVYIIARQHPGETPASYLMQGLLDFLLSDRLQAQELRESYEFRVVPLMNVDGVISGNYRSNVSGSDINRQWMFPSKRMHPEVYHLKQEILASRKRVAMFLDLHAHSRKMNSFFYGSATSHQLKMYPFVCSKLSPWISYQQSAFIDDPSKRTTARVVLEQEVAQSIVSLTFEVSFYGWVDGSNCAHFKQSDLKNIGGSLGLGLFYSFIGMNKFQDSHHEDMKINNLLQADQQPQQQLPRFSTKQQNKLMRNCHRMSQKWKKQLQFEKAKEKEGEEVVLSEGSSLDPLHFELKQEEFDCINQTQVDISSRQSQKLSEGNNCKASDRKVHKSTGKSLLGLSSNQFFMFSAQKQAPTEPNNHKIIPLDLQRLQNELQIKKGTNNQSISDQQRKTQLRITNLSPVISPKPVSKSVSKNHSRYEQAGNSMRDYKQQVFEMRRALKYLLENKGRDYENYKSCFKSMTIDQVDTNALEDIKQINQSMIKGKRKKVIIKP